jgi:hypothetical protein
MNGSPERKQRSGRGGRYRLVLLAFLAIGAFLLLSEQRAHVIGIPPLALLLLLCPLLHFFMHGSHGADAQHGRNDHRSQSLCEEPNRDRVEDGKWTG